MGKIEGKISKFIEKNDTNILIGIGITDGLILGGYLWYSTGKKIQKILSAKEQELNRKLKFKEKVKNTWKIFLLPTINTIFSASTIIYATKLNNKKIAALGAAYNLTEIAFQKFIDKTKDEIGEKKTNAISDEVAKETIKQSNNTVIVSEDGDITFYEPLTDRYFKSTWAKLQKAANELNAAAISGFDGKISLSDWFYKIGLPKTDISDEMGWDVQNGAHDMIDIRIDAILDKEDVPCGAIVYNTRPKYFEY